MADLSGYQIHVTDWRAQIAKNKRRTNMVIILFILTYMILGIIVDFLIVHLEYPQAALETILQGFLHLQVFPYATITMTAVAVISIWITYMMYDKIMLLGTTYHEVTANSTELNDKRLYNVVEEMRIAAGLQYMPRVFLIEADYMNAFASGYSEKSAMVAITRGLFEKLDRNELQAVMAHELSHIRHGDIKLTLMASVLSNIMLIVVDLIFYNFIFSNRRRENGDARIVFLIIILRYVMPLITVVLMLYLSRTREYMADAGCVELMRDNQPLARALLKIDGDYRQNTEHYRSEYDATSHEDVRRAAYLYDPIQTGAESKLSISSLFSTHPTIRDRLKALGIVKDS
jgi:heat shock protein HtpX